MNPLNKIYRTIWSEALGAWVAVSELVKSKGKRAVSSLERVLNIGGVDAATDDIHRHRFKLTALAALCLFSLGAQANPMGGQVVSGSASFNTSGNTLTVTNTPGAIIHWQDFSIQQNEITRFAQQSASSAVLNRVVGGNTSQILGSLQSNGRVFLVNPSGIVFGAGSTVDVAGLVATSLNLSDADFLAGRHRFSNDPNAQAVRNAGNISAQQGGEIWLIAPNVENSGVINAPNGEILLAAGASVELTNSLDPNLRVNITAPAGDATNVGQLVASAGRLGLFGTLVRNSGQVSADSATMQGGKIVFRSSQRTEVSGSASAQGAGGGEIKVLSDMGQGTVEVSGTLDASAPQQGDGGFIDTSAAHVQIRDGARISTLAANGKSGNWLIDPTDFYVSATDPANGSSWMDNTTLSANLGLGNITIQTLATGAGNGDIFINDTVSWSTSSTLTLNAHRHVNINPLISNTGAGNLRIRADLNGTGTGTINFGGVGSVSLTAGAADFYYNPTVFGTPDNYTAKVTGTLREWMLVNNATNLQAINTNLAGNYALGNNVDASSIPSFVPLGNTTTTFTGQFDGLGHTVSNLSIPTPAANQVGLFGVIGAAGTVKDLGLTSVAIQGNSSVGALAGINFGTIFNTYVSGGSVQGGNGAAGGLVGVNQGGDGTAAVGATPGTAGSNASISNSYAENVAVSVSAAVSPAVGGLVGINRGGLGGAGGTGVASTPGGIGGAGGAATLSNSYVSGGSVSGMGAFTTQFAGGLVGQNLGGNGGAGGFGSSSATGGLGGGGGAANISSSYSSSGSISGAVPQAGGLIGRNLTGALGAAGGGLLPGTAGGGGLASATTVAWDSVTTGRAQAIGSGNQDTVINISATPYSQAAYTGFDFTNTWWISASNTRPFLRSEWSTTIANPHQLQLMEMNLASSYILTNNINMTTALSAGGMWSSAGFVPIGYFSGALDGKGFVVSGLNINRPTIAGVGLFSMLAMGSSVSNLGLVGGSVTGNWRVGGLAGTSDGTISSSYVSGMSVSEAGASTLGGLVGQNGYSGSIVNSYVTGGTVTGSGRWIGGLAGLNYGVINGSHVATSTVNGGTAGRSVGGLAGWNASGASITNSFVSNGNVSGQFSVGGLVGNNSSSIGNSYNSGGTVAGSGSVGGVVGFNSSTIDAAYANGVAVSANSNVGGFAGTGYGSISNSYVDSGSVAGSSRFGGFAGVSMSGSVSSSHYNISTVTINGSTGSMVTPYGLYDDVMNIATVGQFSDWRADGVLSIADYSNVLPGSGGSHSIGDLGGMKALLGFAEDPSLIFTLTSALDLTSLPGFYVPVLAADFNGGNFTISNLSINLPTSNELGMFGRVSSASTVSNVVLLNSTVNGTNNVGALVGWNEGDILNSSSTNGAIAGNTHVGGLIGYNKNPYLYSVCSGTCVPLTSGNISNSFVSGGTVQGGFNSVGGLVGHSFGGSIDTSYVTGGNVAGSSVIGGLIGSDGGEGGFISISNSYVANTLVSGVNYVGGMAGWLDGNITSSHVMGGSVSGSSYIGGMVGWLGQSSGTSSQNRYISSSYVDGGTITGTALNIGGLVGMSQGSIDASHVINSSVSGSAQFSAVVGGLVGHNFGSSISNSYVDGGSVHGAGQVGGLVGRNEGGVGGWGWSSNSIGPAGTAASISNSYVTGGTITGDGNVGGLVGVNIMGPSGSGTFSGPGGAAVISNSYVSGGGVSGICTDCGGAAGGLAGYSNGTIQSSFVSGGSVAGANYNGGLVGNNVGSISNSYVSGTSIIGGTSAWSWIYVGGLAGWNNGVIGTSYTNIGTLSGGGSMGAVVGSNDIVGTVTGTFWDNTILGAGVTGIGFDYNTFGPTDVGAAPLDAVGMTTMSNFTNAGWSIANTGGAGMTWRIYEGHTGPLLTSFLTQTTVTANDATKVYDGIAYSGDNGYSTSVAGALLLGSIGGSSQGAVNAGSYVFDVTGLYSSQLGYDITGYTNGTLTITPAGITLLSITASDASKVYGDTYTFNGSAFIPVGLLGGDTIGSVTLSSAGAVSSANAGTYAITPSNAVFTVGSASNYSISYVNGTLTVTPRSITLSAPSLTRTYNGTTSYTATTAQLAAFSSALVSGDVVNAADMSYADKNAGTNKVVNFNSVAINDGNGGGNYSVTLVGNSTSTIDPASLVVTALPAQKVMNAGDPVTFPYSVVNLFDPVATVLSGTLARDPGELIGEYAIKQGSLTLLDTQNYTMTFVPGKFSIMAPAVVQEITQVAFSSGTPESDTTEEEKEKEEEQVLAEADIGNDQGSGLPDNLPVCR